MYKTPTFAEPQQYNIGADPGFQVRGGALKKIAPSGGRRKFFWVFRVKNHEFTPKNHIFSNFRGGCAPTLDPPLQQTFFHGSVMSFHHSVGTLGFATPQWMKSSRSNSGKVSDWSKFLNKFLNSKNSHRFAFKLHFYSKKLKHFYFFYWNAIYIIF